jgi:hypothetical protein
VAEEPGEGNVWPRSHALWKPPLIAKPRLCFILYIFSFIHTTVYHGTYHGKMNRQQCSSAVVGLLVRAASVHRKMYSWFAFFSTFLMMQNHLLLQYYEYVWYSSTTRVRTRTKQGLIEIMNPSVFLSITLARTTMVNKLRTCTTGPVLAGGAPEQTFSRCPVTGMLSGGRVILYAHSLWLLSIYNSIHIMF